MSTLIIANTQIRQDAAGRYCLNDLHQASGSEARHKPGNWMMLGKTQELVAEIVQGNDSTAGIPAVSPVETNQGRYGGGTYAVKELVYAYAMWISAAFHLHVIRAYDALVVEARATVTPELLAFPQHRADQLVSAGRIFSAALRTARQLRLPPARAMQSAFDCARRHTGIDWHAELSVEAADLPRHLDAPPNDSVQQFNDAWQNDQLAVPYGPVLSTDLHAVYTLWCHDRALPALSLGAFVGGLCVRGGPLGQRKRWKVGMETHGPHSFVLPLSHLHAPAGVAEPVWLGQCVQAFRAAYDSGAQPLA